MTKNPYRNIQGGPFPLRDVDGDGRVRVDAVAVVVIDATQRATAVRFVAPVGHDVRHFRHLQQKIEEISAFLESRRSVVLDTTRKSLTWFC